MTRKQGDRINRDFLLQGKPLNSTYIESIPRYFAQTNNAAATNGVMVSAAVPIQAGDVITNITFRSATTAVGTPTNWWFALYSQAATPVLLAQTADQTSGAWAANTTKTLALQTAQTITETGIYYVSVMVAAASGPTLVGATLNHLDLSTGLLAVEKSLARTSGSGLTTTAPGTITADTKVTTIPYAVLS